MKKSNALLFVIIISGILYYITDSLLELIILKINLTILTVGYFIVKQLEENNDNPESN